MTLNPGTPLVTLEEILPLVRQVLVMSVNPGYGGQSLIPGSLRKIQRLRAMLHDQNPSCRIQIDGGVNASNIASVVAAGADTIVAGTAIYSRDRSVAEAMALLRAAVDR